MAQRFTTAVGLIAVLMVLMYFGGAVMGVAAIICICFALYEEYRALSIAGHRPVSWPTWAGLAVSVPLVVIFGTQVIVPMLMGVCLLTTVCVIFREDPKLEDCVLSIMPLLTVLLPGMCICAVALVEPKALQVVLLSLLFVIPVLVDTLAFFVGSRVGGPKLCPMVSPHKTIAGAIGGLAGGMIGALLVGLVASWCCDATVAPMLPTWWEYILLGLVGSVAAQMGDLFASMVKRHCGIKDFSNLFPGHGGMLDRLDSILFMAVVMFCYRLITTI